MVITWRKLAIKSQKNASKIKLMCILAMILQWLCSGFRVHLKYRKLSENYQNKSRIMVYIRLRLMAWWVGGHMTNEHLEVYPGPWTSPCQWYNNIQYQKCDYIIWLPFFLMKILVKIHHYFQKASNFFSILCFSQ